MSHVATQSAIPRELRSGRGSACGLLSGAQRGPEGSDCDCCWLSVFRTDQEAHGKVEMAAAALPE